MQAEYHHPPDKAVSLIKPTGDLSELGEGFHLTQEQFLAKEQILNELADTTERDARVKELMAKELTLTDVKDYQLWQSQVEELLQQNQELIDHMRAVAELHPEAETAVAGLLKRLGDQQESNEYTVQNFHRQTSAREEQWMDYRAAQAHQKMLQPLRETIMRAKWKFNEAWQSRDSANPKGYDKTNPEAPVYLAQTKAELEQAVAAYNNMVDHLYSGSKGISRGDLDKYHAEVGGKFSAPAMPDYRYVNPLGSYFLDNELKWRRKFIGNAITEFYSDLEQAQPRAEEALAA